VSASAVAMSLLGSGITRTTRIHSLPSSWSRHFTARLSPLVCARACNLTFSPILLSNTRYSDSTRSLPPSTVHPHNPLHQLRQAGSTTSTLRTARPSQLISGSARYCHLVAAPPLPRPWLSKGAPESLNLCLQSPTCATLTPGLLPNGPSRHRHRSGSDQSGSPTGGGAQGRETTRLH